LEEKKPVLACSILAAIFYTIKYLVIVSKEDNYSVFWIDIVLRFCININFYILTVWTIEFYPMDISMLASNLNRLSSRIGRIYSPIILLSHRKIITAQIAAFMTIASCLLFLPKDTTGTIIKETTTIASKKEEPLEAVAEEKSLYDKENEFNKENCINEETHKFINKKRE